MPTQDSTQVLYNKPTHQILAQEIYKRSAELLEEKRHTENLLYNISEAVIAVDTASKINILNKTAEELINMSTEKAEGKALDEVLVLTSESGDKIESKNYCFKLQDVTIQNLMHESKGITRYLKLQSTTIKNPRQEDECIITLTDVTREKMLEKSKDEFISITSHELRTPMTIIRSYLWMMDNVRYGELNSKQHEFLSKAQGGVQRMLSMINDTLNASKIDQGKLQLKMEEIKIREFLERLSQDFELKAKEKGLKFKVSIDENCQVVYSDKGKLEETLTNLLGNSVKFTSAGEINLKVTKNDNSFVKFEVSDTGKGIDPANLKQLFHKFGRIDNSYQTVAEAGGTGLGLYIVKNIVENMGGRVGAWSAGIGKGATFWFTLPSEYYEIPQNLRESAILTLAPVLETRISSICPV
ncbi:MAG: ATP-binding protein [Patescibacteria group bacterium]